MDGLGLLNPGRRVELAHLNSLAAGPQRHNSGSSRSIRFGWLVPRFLVRIFFHGKTPADRTWL
jgi:hypothetical protein